MKIRTNYDIYARCLNISSDEEYLIKYKENIICTYTRDSPALRARPHQHFTPLTNFMVLSPF
jgi:hypothetical protein